MKKITTLIVICILVAGCMGENPPEESPEKPGEHIVKDEKEVEDEPLMTMEILYQFAPYTPVPVQFTGAGISYPFEPDNLTIFPLSPEQERALKTNGFVVAPAWYDQFFDVYQNCKESNMPIFVTTDSVLHTYHILYDYTLRILETEHLSQDLEVLTVTMKDISYEYYRDTGDQAVLKNMAYFCVAGKLLDNTFAVPSEVEELVNQELSLIEAHKGFAVSPIFGYKEDYSQYVPRGHYTRSETLKKYFRAMMWYGRIMFRLKSEEETKQALFIVKAIIDTQTLDMWDTIYEPTVFFVGKSDDLNIIEYKTLAEEVYGELTIVNLQDTQLLKEFMERAQAYQDPRINSTWVKDTEDVAEETKGFRFMGQRFIPDSYMFQQLVYDKVGTATDPRLFPKGLDVMAVLGSERALHHLESEKKYINYEKQMEALKNEFSILDQSVWTQNLYWTWLYSLIPLLEKKDNRYPLFMQSDAWIDKELNTALASWTELRHDTILYAKQSYTLEATAIPSQPQVTRGYVEPNPYVYARLYGLARMMKEGLQQRELLLPEYRKKLETLEDLLFQLKIISEKELSGERLTEEEYLLIWNIGNTLEFLVTFETAVETETDEHVALVADVHTDVNTGKVLEEGVGDVFLIFVVVQVEGRIFMTVGGVFSYYEFLQPMSDRLTDEKWQAMDKPSLPEWTRSFIIQ
ncbi:MAG: DUF3160 domain-containing protein [Theionarchaea archaeon]|nr:DUF3160 domain-containing protein [Theionarchaea archaeon]